MKIVPADDDGIKQAASVIRDGGIVAYPLDSGYALGCLPSDPDATKKICELKESAENPLPVICGDVEMARRVVTFHRTADILAENFWPGPLSMVLQSRVEYSMWVMHGKGTLAVSVPSDKVASKLAQLSRGVIISSSARKGEDELPRTAEEVKQRFTSKIDLILDGKPPLNNLQSTILDVSGKEMWILRSGVVSGSEILDALKR
jgi:L-threonylcarbamoyladenylate synthase